MTGTDLAARIGQAQSPEKRTAHDLLASMKDEFRKALPKHIHIDQFMRLVLTEVRTNPTLGTCSQASLLGSIMTAARLGLEYGGPMGEYYPTPRRVKGEMSVVGIIGYRGLLKLARNAGTGAIGARVIREGDTYIEGATSERGLYFEWQPLDVGDTDRPITGALAVARLAGGDTQHIYLTRKQIEDRRDAGAAGKSGPWRDHYEAMVRKTVLRELTKTLPMSTAVGLAVATDEQVQTWAPGQDVAPPAADQVETVTQVDPTGEPEAEWAEARKPGEGK